MDDTSLSLLLRQGNSIDAAQADAIEKRLETSPGSVQDRVQLLGFYYLKQSDPVAAAKRRPHVLWLIENYPASSLSGQSQVQLRPNDPGLPAAREIWLRQAANHPDDPAILMNAGSYFINSDPSLSEKMYLKGKALQPGDARWPTRLGEVYRLKAQFPTASNLTLTVPEASTKALEEYEGAFAISRRTSLFAPLADAARRANVLDKAANYATQAIGTGESDAIHDGNHTLGEMALEKGDLTAAKNYLLASGKVPASPVLSSFGPRMKLANELLKKGERAAVQTYLEECLTFWTSGQDRLKGWIDSLKQGQSPDLANGAR